jgi:hypothetical protein
MIIKTKFRTEYISTIKIRDLFSKSLTLPCVTELVTLPL